MSRLPECRRCPMTCSVRLRTDFQPFPNPLLVTGDLMSRTSRRWIASEQNIAVLLLIAGLSSGACSGGAAPRAEVVPANASPRADLILTNARVYTLAWGEPAADGAPAANAPHGPAGW